MMSSAKKAGSSISWRCVIFIAIYDAVCQGLATGRRFSLNAHLPIKLTKPYYWNVVKTGVFPCSFCHCIVCLRSVIDLLINCFLVPLWYFQTQIDDKRCDFHFLMVNLPFFMQNKNSCVCFCKFQLHVIFQSMFL